MLLKTTEKYRDEYLRGGDRRLATALRSVAAVAFGALISLLCQAASFEDGRAAYLSGDYAAALNILRPLADSGDAKAQVTLGIMYDLGHGVTRDPAAAIGWYRKAAAQGAAAVQHDLGVKYFRGDGVDRDYAEAARWWRLAADQGLAESQYNLALLYVRGLGVERDPQSARSWYEKAANQGHPEAQYSLGVIYAEGDGVPSDPAQAVAWFTKAANQGLPQAQYNLGVLVEGGRGVAGDMNVARDWYHRAADQGLEEAKMRLYELDRQAEAEAARAAMQPTQPMQPEPAVSASASTEEPPGGAAMQIHGADWIRSQQPERYTLQIASSTDETALLTLLQRSALSGEAAYFRADVGGAPRYTAVFGTFDSYGAAETALAGLPPDLRKGKPWIRKFDTLQRLLPQ